MAASPGNWLPRGILRRSGDHGDSHDKTGSGDGEEESAQPKIRQTKLLIDGKWVNAASGKTFDTINPATGEVIAHVAEADKADVDKAVEAARRAFEGGAWSQMSAAERGRLLNRLADLVEENKEELAALETLNNGKPISDSLNGDLPLTIACYRYYAGWTDKIHGKTIPVNGPYFCYTRHEPVGVVGQIIPWNFPLLMQAWKLGPALACGCTVVMKPAEQTPLSALRVGELILEAGFPPGVVNLLPGYGPTAGQAISRHPGHRQGGLHRLDRGGPHDHGGRRADQPQAGDARTGRQEPEHRVCRHRSRRGRAGLALRPVLQPGTVLLCREPAVCRAVDPRKVRREDRGHDQAPQGGRPVRSGHGAGAAGLRRAVPESDELHRRRASAKGREMLCGGKRVGDRGYFIAPTIFDDVKDDMKIAREEIFGPVMSVIPFKSHRRSRSPCQQHDVRPGGGRLDAGHRKAHAIAARLRAGTVWVNCYDVFDAAAPFGGFKMSGIGRELGEYGLQNYTEVKTVTVKI